MYDVYVSLLNSWQANRENPHKYSKWVLGDMKPQSLERNMHMYTQWSFLFDFSILDVDSEILHGFLFWCFKSIATVIFIWIQKDFFYKNPNFSRVNIPVCLLESITLCVLVNLLPLCCSVYFSSEEYRQFFYHCVVMEIGFIVTRIH